MNNNKIKTNLKKGIKYLGFCLGVSIIESIFIGLLVNGGIVCSKSGCCKLREMGSRYCKDHK
jgi:hypothetical protein